MAGATADRAQSALNHVRELIRRQDFRRAVPACQEFNRRFPNHADGWAVTGDLALHLGAADHAREAFRQALALRPDEPRWQLQQAQCLKAMGEGTKAREKAVRLAEGRLDDVDQAATLAGLLFELNAAREAESVYHRAIKLNPESSHLNFGLATIQNGLGQFEAAESSCDRAIELAPDFHEAYFLRSNLRRQTHDRNHVDELQSVLDRGVDNLLGRAQVSYALAKELEDLRDFDRSFEALQRGAKARRSTFQYRVDDDIRFIDRIRTVYDRTFFEQAGKGHDTREPIFIVGLPRTGTTLIERVLSSHSDVFSAGELPHFPRQMSAAIEQRAAGRNLSPDQMVDLGRELDFDSLGRGYIEQTRPATGHTPRFIDKFPPNALYLGLIHQALPNARIVLLERHPMDTCYAIYKQLFTDIYQFSYDLEELGRYFIAHQRLMDHWRSVMPGVIHTVRYEDFIRNLGDEARGLIEHCGLEWQDQCLSYQDNGQPCITASASQVRQPIYTSSIGKWKHFARPLEPLRRMLEQAGCLADWEDPPPP